MATSERSLAHLLDPDTLAVVIKSVRWLGYRLGIPASVTRQSVRAVLSTEVPLTPVLDEHGLRIGTLVEADPSALLALAHEALIAHLSAAGYPTDPAQWK